MFGAQEVSQLALKDLQRILCNFDALGTVGLQRGQCSFPANNTAAKVSDNPSRIVYDLNSQGLRKDTAHHVWPPVSRPIDISLRRPNSNG